MGKVGIATMAGAVVAGVFGVATGIAVAGTAHAATPTFDRKIAYVRSGNVYVSSGATEKKVTTDGSNARPAWSPDGKRIAYLHGGTVWVMNADGTGKQRVTPWQAGRPAWSPDGSSIAFAARSCTGGPGVYRVPAAAPYGTPAVVFPASCRTEPVAGSTVAASNTGGDLATRLRRDDAIAWSPDGAKIAFRGGECESVYDDCLSVGDVASGAERTVQAYGGGGSSDGFAAVPAWRPDGARLAWTASSTNESTGTSQPVHIREADPAGGSQRIVGKASDRELAYYSTSKALVTGQYNGSSWVILVDLATGARKPFHAGSQAAVSPVRA